MVRKTPRKSERRFFHVFPRFLLVLGTSTYLRRTKVCNSLYWNVPLPTVSLRWKENRNVNVRLEPGRMYIENYFLRLICFVFSSTNLCFFILLIIFKFEVKLFKISWEYFLTSNIFNEFLILLFLFFIDWFNITFNFFFSVN